MSQNKRSLKNYLISPREQVEFGMKVLGVPLAGGLLVLLISQAPLAMSLHAASRFLTAEDQRGLAELTTRILRQEAVLIGFGALYLLGYVIVVSHRLFGPMVAINRYIEGLANGTAPETLTLRDGDYFGETAARLMRLRQKLQGGGAGPGAPPAV